MKKGIAAFAFGTPAEILSNQRIAQIASQKAREFGTAVYTQSDVKIEEGIEAEIIEEEPGQPPPTLRIAREAVKWAKAKGFKELWIVAAEPHIRRCVRDLTKAVEETQAEIEIQVCREISQFSKDEWFCADSTQARTRSRKNWQKRERILKWMPFWLYKRIAS